MAVSERERRTPERRLLWWGLAATMLLAVAIGAVSFFLAVWTCVILLARWGCIGQ